MRWIALCGAALVPLSVVAETTDKGLDYQVGQALFERLWVSSPASTTSSDGLGPLYSARSCAACHPPAGRGTTDEAVLRLSPADPIYGHQIQTRGVAGIAAEADVLVGYSFQDINLDDGTVITLRSPEIRLDNLAYGPIDTLTGASLRIAPALPGMGQIAGISAEAITANADPNDDNGDGISGRVQTLSTGQVGRFGWRADQPTLPDQIAAAFLMDLGMASPQMPAPWGDCTPAQTACRAAPHGGTPEITAELMELITYFTANLDAPAPATGAGATLFAETGCASCHQPDLDGVPAYTDLLMHDMGPGLSAIGETATEWRTPPLWGTGLTESAQGQTTYLHDGRARTLTEAILWHGGEGLAAQRKFMGLSASDRADLISFLEGL